MSLIKGIHLQRGRRGEEGCISSKPYTRPPLFLRADYLSPHLLPDAHVGPTGAGLAEAVRRHVRAVLSHAEPVRVGAKGEGGGDERRGSVR